MSVTVADCLKLPALCKAQLVAGQGGLGKIVSSVSVVEFVEVNLMTSRRVFTPNEIVLSAFYAIKDDVMAQCNTIEWLCRSGDVALILYYVGHYLPTVHQSLADTCNQLDFPLIVMPVGEPTLAYRDVIGDIMEAVVYDRLREGRLRNDVLERITQLPTHQRSVDNVLQMLSEQLKCSLFLADGALQCIQGHRLAAANLPPEEGLLSPFAALPPAERMQTLMLPNKQGAEVPVYRIPFTEEPLRALSLVVVDEFGGVSQENLHAAAEVLQLFSRIWSVPLDTQQPDALVHAVLGDNTERSRRIAAGSHINLDSLDTMLVLRLEEADATAPRQARLLKDTLAVVKGHLQAYGKPPVASVYNGQVVALLAHDPGDEGFLPELQAALAAAGLSCSLTMAGHLSTNKSIQTAFLHHSRHIDAARAIQPTQPLVTAADLQFAAECRGILAEEEEDGFYKRRMALLQAHEEGSELIRTLVTYYIDTGANAKETSRLLFIHRNTVQYRLAKLRQLLGANAEGMRTAEDYMLYRLAALCRLAGAGAS